MPSTELVAKGRNSYVSLTHADDHVDWIGFKTPLAAQEAATAIELGFSDAQVVTLDTFFNRFMSNHAIPNLSQDTVSRYRSVYDGQIRSILGAKTLATLSVADVKALQAKLKTQGESNGHIDSATDVLSAILGVAVKWRYIKSNPINNLDS